MSRILVNETDEAFIVRANLVLHMAEDRTQRWSKCPNEMMTWKDVFMSFVGDPNGPNALWPCAVMNVLVLESDDAGRSQVGLDKLLARTYIKAKRRLLEALHTLEQDGWISRRPDNEFWLEQRLVKRAKGIYMKLAREAGCSVYFDDEIGTYSAFKNQSVTVRQTSLRLAEPRRTLGGRTFFVLQNKTS